MRKKTLVIYDWQDTIVYETEEIDNSAIQAYAKLAQLVGVDNLIGVTGASCPMFHVSAKPLIQSLKATISGVTQYFEHGLWAANGSLERAVRRPEDIISFIWKTDRNEAAKKLEGYLINSRQVKEELSDLLGDFVYQDNRQFNGEQIKVTLKPSYQRFSTAFERTLRDYGLEYSPPVKEWGDIFRFNPNYWNIFTNNLREQVKDMTTYKGVLKRVEGELENEMKQVAGRIKKALKDIGILDKYDVESYHTAAEMIPREIDKGTAVAYELSIRNKPDLAIVLGDSESDLKMKEASEKYGIKTCMVIPKGSNLYKLLGCQEGFSIADDIGASVLLRAIEIVKGETR